MFRAATCPSSGELIVSIRHLACVTLYRWLFGVQVWMRLQSRLIQTCTPDGHLHRVTYTRCRIDKINSADDEHMSARNMYRIEINIHEKELCVQLVLYKDYTEMHGQQNIKSDPVFCRTVSFKPAHQTVIYTEWHMPDVILIQLILLMMGTWLPGTCRV